MRACSTGIRELSLKRFLSLPAANRAFIPCRSFTATRHFLLCHRLRFSTIGRNAAHTSFPNNHPRQEPAPWIALLDGSLPAHLRVSNLDTPQNPGNIKSIAEILLAANTIGASIKNRHGQGLELDLLHYLAIDQGRWKAVVYLVKQLVEAFSLPTLPVSLPNDAPWSQTESLSELTRAPIQFDPASILRTRPIGSQTLDESTSNKAEGMLHDEEFAKRVLGHVWRSLGSMVISCADTEIAPEILEILAYLHHQGLMPLSIYSAKPNPDSTAVQQPPTLNLLSSRILTALSDAAWRAQQKLLDEQTEPKRSNYFSLSPQNPGSAYKMRISGLRPEIWLEIILWACLHGGWVQEGTEILRAISSINDGDQWQPLSWDTVMPDEAHQVRSQRQWDALFSTHPGSAKGDDVPMTYDVRRTISSEVVTAYTDAIISSLGTGWDKPAVPIKPFLDRLLLMHELLGRARLSKIGGGSWDVVIARVYDSYRDDLLLSPPALSKLLSLSPSFGLEQQSLDPQTEPSHVLERSSIIIGIHHLALRAAITDGNCRTALHVLKSLQQYTDENKRDSIRAFFAKASNPLKSRSSSFDANYTPIEFSAFDMQIPATILDPLMELMLDSSQYEMCEWLLFDESADGPIIPESRYAEPLLTSSLLRFAAETDNHRLLTKLLNLEAPAESTGDGKSNHRGSVLRPFLQAQLRRSQWVAARGGLEYIHQSRDLYWTAKTLALLVQRMMSYLKEVRTQRMRAKTLRSQNIALQHSGKQQMELPEISKARENLQTAEKLFVELISGRFDSTQFSSSRRGNVRTSLIILASVDPYWADLTLWKLRLQRGYTTFSLPVEVFNILLNGVLDSYGSSAGQILVNTFWPAHVRRAQQINSQGYVSPLDTVERQRTTLELKGRTKSERIIMYGGLRPNSHTIHLILDSLLREIKEARTESRSAANSAQADPHSANGTDPLTLSKLHWVIEAIRTVAPEDDYLVPRITSQLSPQELEALGPQLSNLYSG